MTSPYRGVLRMIGSGVGGVQIRCMIRGLRASSCGKMVDVLFLQIGLNGSFLAIT